MSGRGRSELVGGEIDGCEAGDDCRAGIFQIFPVVEKLACAAGIVRVKARWADVIDGKNIQFISA